MNCEDFRELYHLYALGVLEGAECDALESHLNRSCPTCMENMRRAVEENARILKSAPKLEPSSHLRNRVLAGFGLETRSIWLRAAPWAVTAAALAGLSIALVPGSHRMTEPNKLDRTAMDFLNAPGTKQFSFGTNGAAPHGNVLVSAEKGVLLVVANLAAAPSGKMYETWVIPMVGAPRPIGQLVATADGSSIGLIPGPVNPAGIKAVAVSLEPAGTFPLKPTTVVFAAPTE